MNRACRTIKLSMSAATVVTFFIIQPGHAQTAAAESPPVASGTDALSEIIVTARRTAERLEDVPISITVFAQEDLSRTNVVDAVDLAQQTPSLSVNNNFGNENASFAIRGFVQDAGTAPSVGTYFADVVVPRGPTQGTQAGDSVGPGSFFDLQNVQVLKGPQGTLFGRNTTGGAVLLVPQKPGSVFDGYAEVSTGNYGMLRTQGALNAPLAEWARLRIAVDHESRDGWLKNTSGIGASNFNDVGYTAVRASLVLDLGSNIESYTIASYSRSDTNGSVQKMIAASQIGTHPLDAAAGFPNFIGVFSAAQLAAESARGAGFYDVESSLEGPESRLTQWQVINTSTWNASDALTVKNIASYAQFTDVQRSPLFGTNWQLNNLPPVYQFLFQAGVPSGLAVVTPAPGHVAADQSTYTEELQLQGTVLNSRLTYQGGAYFEWSDPLSTVGFQSNSLLACTNLAALQCADPLGIAFSALSGFPTNIGATNLTLGETTFRDQGVYAQSSYSLTDQLKVTGGVRYTWDKTSNEATRITYEFPVTPPFTAPAAARCTDLTETAAGCAQALEKRSGAPTWLLDLDYKPADEVLIYGKWARGYRAGGVYANAPSDHHTFDPEKIDSYELGLKTAFRGAVPTVFNLSAFYNNLSNQQLQIGFNPHRDPVTGALAPVAQTAAIVNAGKSRVYGVEAELSVTPLKGVTLSANYTYLATAIRSIAPVVTTDPNYDVSSYLKPGDPLALSPRHKVVLSSRYTLPLDQHYGTVSLGASYLYTARQLTNYAYYNPANVALMHADYGSVPGYGLVNLDLGWNSIFGTGLSVSAFGTNVTNKNYYLYIPGLGQSGVEFASLGEPRMYGVRLRYSFGQ
jgi:iron complex outermembrane recepter protein